jgi:hypothetical protein
MKMFGFLSVVFIVLFVSACKNGGSGGGVATGKAVLSWTTPTQYRNGAPIAGDLMGFKVKFGTERQHYTHVINVPFDAAMATSATCTVTGLPMGATYYFVVTAYTGHAESNNSQEVSKLIN